MLGDIRCILWVEQEPKWVVVTLDYVKVTKQVFQGIDNWLMKMMKGYLMLKV